MSNSANHRAPLTPTRKRLYRLGAVLFGLALVASIEIALRIAGVGAVERLSNPLVGFSEIRPLFVKNETGDRYETSKDRLAFFQPDSFASEKSPDEYRVFCLGGSTVQGRPYSIETSFTTWLELTLKAADPEREWEVVNCGGVSYASYRLVPIMRETLNYQPDLFIVYTGHNEFLEERSYSSIKRRPRWLKRLHGRVAQLRIYGVLQSLKPDPQPEEKIRLQAEVDALLDYQGGLAKYHRDDEWRNGVIYEYEQNLKRLIEIADRHDVPVLLINPVSNLRDTPPFKVELPPEFDADQRAEFERRWRIAKEAPWDDLDGKLATVQRVLALDSRHADANFLLAKVHEARGEFKRAKQAYEHAKDEDVCPLRMLESMHQVLQDVAAGSGTELIDIRADFERDAEFGIPGNEQLIDHVHPRLEGHQKIAEEIFEVLVRHGIVVPRAAWTDAQKELYRANFASLPESYFPESVERLRGLQRWAAGRVNRLKLPTKEPEGSSGK